MAEKCKSKNYVADVCKELMSRATFGTLRNIIRAATYLFENVAAVELALVVEVQLDSRTPTVPLSAGFFTSFTPGVGGKYSLTTCLSRRVFPRPAVVYAVARQVFCVRCLCGCSIGRHARRSADWSVRKSI